MDSIFHYRKFYITLVLVGLFLWISATIPLQAKVLGPGWFIVEADPVSIQEARTYYTRKARIALRTFGYEGVSSTVATADRASCATAITPEIEELAYALQYKPKLIYDYVHNHIDYIPYFGSLKGATLTYLDGAGNDFDQASLMIALLRASGYAASYEFGMMTIPFETLANWVGVGSSRSVIRYVFARGGIPVDESLDEVDKIGIARVWVKARIDGSDYVFDPALKSYTYVPRIDISQAISYDQSELLAAVTDGATIDGDYVENLNEALLREQVVRYANNLVNTLRSEYPNGTVDELISSRQVSQETLTEYSVSLPFPATLEAACDEIPPEYTATFRVQHEGIDHTFYVPEIAGRRLTITYTGQGHYPELRLDGELIAQGTATSLGRWYDAIYTIDHPYAADDGTYCDQTETDSLKIGSTYALVSAFAGISDILIDNRQTKLDEYRAAGLTKTSEAILGESLNIAGLTYFRERQLVHRLATGISDFLAFSHHENATLSQGSTYGIDVGMIVGSWTHKHDKAVKRGPMTRAIWVLSSAFEHAVFEQMMGSNIPCVSTVKLLQIANRNRDKIFYADKSNFPTIRERYLHNYSETKLDGFQSKLDSGDVDWYILPEDGQIEVNEWRGVGYLGCGGCIAPGWYISGGVSGGAGTEDADLDPEEIEENIPRPGDSEQAAENQPGYSEDPVNMATGSFVHNRTDLSLGNRVPKGLSFSRSYCSRLNRRNRSFGYGWTHNYDIYLRYISNFEPALGQRQPIDVASIVTALHVMKDLLVEPNDVLHWMTAILIGKWAIDQLIDNGITVCLGSKTMDFVKLADGTYAPPPSITTQLIDSADGTFGLVERFGTCVDFGSNDRIKRLTDVDGNAITFTYRWGDLVRIEDAFGRRLNLDYRDEHISSVSDSTDRTIYYTYDANDDLTSYTDPEGNVWAYAYDAEHHMTTITNPLGITTVTNTYDSLDRVDSQTTPRQGDTTATYDFHLPGFKNIEKDPNGGETVYFFDENGNSTGQQNALGQGNSREYDGQYHVVKTTDPRGSETNYIYDGSDNLVSVIDAQDKITGFAYDSQFRLTDIIDPLGNSIHMDYDDKHHLIQRVDSEGNAIGYTYYLEGLLESVTDSRGTTTTLTYDSKGNPQTARVGSHPPVRYDYDVTGLLISLTDQAGATTRFAYDKRGLPIEITDPLGKNTLFVRDDVGRLLSRTDRNGDTITYTYTPSGKFDSLNPEGSSAISFTYDHLDNLVQMQDAIGTTNYTYDAANRLTSITNPHRFKVSCEYDEAGNVTAITYPPNKTVAYTYDALNRLDSVTNWLGQTASYAYDEVGRLVRFVNFNGTVTNYGYDKADRLVSLENLKSDGTPIATYQFTLDGSGNRTQVIQNEPLPVELTTGATYYKYNTKRNRLQTAGPLNFTWDDEGQLSSINTTTFSFDSLHRLIGVRGATICEYAYNGLNHRLETVRDGVITRYIYGASGNLLAEADASNVITHYYIHGLGLLAMIIPAGETYCYHYNAVGSTIAMSDQSQKLVNTYTYTPFGITPDQVETISQPFKFAGRYGVMAESNGLYYMRARYYDPVVGRFISEDPIMFDGGSVNLYAYAFNNPVNAVDAFGTCPEQLPWWWRNPLDWIIPGYGACGGPCREGQTPIDDMDEAFRQHDIALPKGTGLLGEEGRRAHKELIEDLRDLPIDPRKWDRPPKNPLYATIYRLAAIGLFEQLILIGETLGIQ